MCAMLELNTWRKALFRIKNSDFVMNTEEAECLVIFSQFLLEIWVLCGCNFIFFLLKLFTIFGLPGFTGYNSFHQNVARG